jgi:hypothetical protein
VSSARRAPCRPQPVAACAPRRAAPMPRRVNTPAGTRRRPAPACSGALRAGGAPARVCSVLRSGSLRSAGGTHREAARHGRRAALQPPRLRRHDAPACQPPGLRGARRARQRRRTKGERGEKRLPGDEKHERRMRACTCRILGGSRERAPPAAPAAAATHLRGARAGAVCGRRRPGSASCFCGSFAPSFCRPCVGPCSSRTVKTGRRARRKADLHCSPARVCADAWQHDAATHAEQSRNTQELCCTASWKSARARACARLLARTQRDCPFTHPTTYPPAARRRPRASRVRPGGNGHAPAAAPHSSRARAHAHSIRNRALMTGSRTRPPCAARPLTARRSCAPPPLGWS